MGLLADEAVAVVLNRITPDSSTKKYRSPLFLGAAGSARAFHSKLFPVTIVNR
jgi:hypothetical protein